jgi:hypothetical protein
MIGAFIPHGEDYVGSLDPLRVLARLQLWFGDALECDPKDQFDGNVEKLVGVVQRKTGETRSKIETYFM